jgi:hypothetical protein
MDVVSYTWSMALQTQALLLLDSISIPPDHDCFRNGYKTVSQFLKQLADLSYHSQDEPLTTSAKRLIEGFLDNMRTETNKKQPIRPTNWSRKPVKCTDGRCGGECTILNKFLQDGRQASYRFKTAEHNRKHIQYALPYGEYRFETDRDHGTPFTLIVTKTTEGFAKELRNWESEVKERRQCLGSLQSDFMKAMLGERYNELVCLEPIPSLSEPSSKARAEQHSLQEMTPETQNARAVPPVAGVKRKAREIEVIDLT